ncbi:MAG: DNA recombination protein RmuC [Novosphingobium sp.]
MDWQLLIIVAALGGAVAGAAVGWLAGARPVAEWRSRHAALEAENKAIDQAHLRTQIDLAAANERAASAAAVEGELVAVRAQHGAARDELATLKANAANFAEQQRLLLEAKAALAKEFEAAGAKVLEGAQEAFLKRADQRFAQAGETGEQKLKALLAPVETTLKRYEDNLSRVEKEREGCYRDLNRAVADLALGNDVVRRETQRLANVLRSSPKARGRWGEEQLKTILESAGLSENVDFHLQSTVNDGERQLRPDCVINLPGGRCIVVDVKCPLVAFEQAYDEEDESRRADLLLAHANAIKAYANDLGRKGYWRQFERSPDFVIMFVPGEHFLSAAAERAPDLIETAFRNGVIVASTINMLALAKVMAGMWRQEALAEQAHAIHALGKELYARIAVMAGHAAKLGQNLTKAAGAYNDFVGSLESKVLTQARRFDELKVETGGKPIDSLPLVDVSIRPLVKLASTGGMGDEEITSLAS